MVQSEAATPQPIRGVRGNPLIRIQKFEMSGNTFVSLLSSTFQQYVLHRIEQPVKMACVVIEGRQPLEFQKQTLVELRRQHLRGPEASSVAKYEV